MTATTDVLTEKPRVSSIDIMRGLVMVIMALDHARDFYHSDALVFDPTNLEKTNPILFYTRIITHWCAPTFVLLSGVSVRISEQRKSKNELSIFLLTRGLWLVLLELTVVRFGIFFNLYYDVLIFQVIWAIGISMVILAALIHLPFKIIVAFGAIITLGHDALHAVPLKQGDPLFNLWAFVHPASFFEIIPGRFTMIPYPFLPWLGIMLLGYGLGEWYTSRYDTNTRRKYLIYTGWIAIALFVVLRAVNLYGDPAPWSVQKNFLFSVMSFMNVTKYPVSLLYTLMTLGPVMLLLAWMENFKSTALKPFAVFGRVPLFYYILHFYLLHLGAITIYCIINGLSLADLNYHFNAGFGGLPPGSGYSLVWAYVAWISVVLLLYPVCKWYNRYKSTHNHWWLSYL